MRRVLLGGFTVAVPTSGCANGPSQDSTSSRPMPSQPAEEAERYVGFHPRSRIEHGNVVMPLTFVDGSSAEIVAPLDLGVQDMAAASYTAAGLGGVDRTRRRPRAFG